MFEDQMETVIVLVVGLFLGFMIGTLYWIPKFEEYQRTFDAELKAIKVRLVAIRKQANMQAFESVKKKKDEEHKWEKDHQEDLIE